MKIYVASSWRNEQQAVVVRALREFGHEVYDFRNPPLGDRGFHWSDISAKWQAWTPAEFQAALSHPIAVAGYQSDQDGMVWADACVLVMPCGRSAHLEAGWFVGAGKPCLILLSNGDPELMYKMAVPCLDLDEVQAALQRSQP